MKIDWRKYITKEDIKTSTKHKMVPMIPNGYRWDCPKCGSDNLSPGIKRTVQCPVCGSVFVSGTKDVFDDSPSFPTKEFEV